MGINEEGLTGGSVMITDEGAGAEIFKGTVDKLEEEEDKKEA